MATIDSGMIYFYLNLIKLFNNCHGTILALFFSMFGFRLALGRCFFRFLTFWRLFFLCLSRTLTVFSRLSFSVSYTRFFHSIVFVSHCLSVSLPTLLLLIMTPLHSFLHTSPRPKSNSLCPSPSLSYLSSLILSLSFITSFFPPNTIFYYLNLYRNVA